MSLWKAPLLALASVASSSSSSITIGYVQQVAAEAEMGSGFVDMLPRLLYCLLSMLSTDISGTSYIATSESSDHPNSEKQSSMSPSFFRKACKRA